MADRDPQQPMGELRDLGRFVDERYQFELADGFYGALYSPIRPVVAKAIESGEFRDNDPDFLTWSFLGLFSGMLEVLRAPSGSPALKAVSGGENTADQMVDLYLNGVLSCNGTSFFI